MRIAAGKADDGGDSVDESPSAIGLTGNGSAGNENS